MGDVYERSLQSLVGRHTATLCVLLGMLLLLLLITWIFPLLYKRVKADKIKSKWLSVALVLLFSSAKEPKKGKKGKISMLLAQCIVTLIFVGIMMLGMIPSIQEIQLLKKDIAENSYITYVGEYAIDTDYSSSRHINLSHLWLKERFITLTDINESVKVDESGTWKFPDYYSESSGTIVYGKHSKCIIYIDGLDGFWE